ncbi:Putative peptidoglycan binding domain-containing protein [Pseudoxanthomonas sp. GM95]|uniref:peptidoglycan-binding protein n=1 Tax=Pseudoxanthomonas sp. GM95 TaxID=1881043 RepID=UPI0008C09D22|nr:peptidoglycan-binding protein [Pseudoxanthomonas sp. GM95]SEL46134.1 Putative peptidoglycan binding domain-containing protein [Pseudoxanthomonas sp. GM95]
MARDYPKSEVLDIIETQAKQHGIPRDDFMRFAYIETGGTFDERASRGAHGAKGLFQFVPDTARDYGIAGRELDPVANTDAAARLYLHNRQQLTRHHEQDGRPYLSGKPQPDGLDLYLAHQQGAAGYASIQTAIATGEFGRSSTRALIINNVSERDFERVTHQSYERFTHMSDRDMAKAFTGYWEAKFQHVSIPEKQIQPLTATAAPQRSEAAAEPAKPTPKPEHGIALEQAYALTRKYDDVTYKLGGKHPEQGSVDCSGWVGTLQNATMLEINQKSHQAIFSKTDRFDLGNDSASEIVRKSQQRSGVMIEGKAVTAGVLKEGMIIGEDNGPTSFDKGRFKGIDHITMVVRDPKSGALMISQSRGGEGVELTTVDRYLDYKQSHGVKLYATDPLSKARDLLQDRAQTQTQDRGETVAKPAQDARHADGPRTLKDGAKGEDVQQTQALLNRFGYRDGEGKPLREDGDFGSRSTTAVKAFQQAHGLEADGVIGSKTREALQGAAKAPLLADANHPDNAMYKQAVAGMETLGPGAFKDHHALENAAAKMVFEARVSGLKQIDHVVQSPDGKGLFAVQGELNSAAHQRIYLDKAQATQQPAEQSALQLRQEVAATPAPALDASQRTQERENATRAMA